jgi:hypothetical protein
MRPVLWAAAAAAAAAAVLAGEVATVWAFNYFFYNKKMKRILYIGVKALSKTAAEEEKVCLFIEQQQEEGSQSKGLGGCGRGLVWFSAVEEEKVWFGLLAVRGLLALLCLQGLLTAHMTGNC